jgi:hypothetical protein
MRAKCVPIEVQWKWNLSNHIQRNFKQESNTNYRNYFQKLNKQADIQEEGISLQFLYVMNISQLKINNVAHYKFGGEIFHTRPDRYWGPPSLLYNEYRVFPVGIADGAWRLPPTSIYRLGQRKSRAIPLRPIWAFVVCSRLNFTFTLHSKWSS